jgi:hypothetical protein
MYQIMDIEGVELSTEYEKKLDLFTVYVKDEVVNPLKTIESPLFDGNILFKVDSVTGELVKIVIYDFSVVRRKLMTDLVFLWTKKAIKNWLQMLVTTFQLGNQIPREPLLQTQPDG